MRRRINTFRVLSGLLLAQAQLGDQCTISFDIGALQVVEQTTTLTNHQQQAAAGVVVLLVHLQMLVQVVDAGGQQSDLNLRRASFLLK